MRGKQSGAVGRLATIRLLAQRFAFLSLVAAAFLLMILGKADIVLIERTRTMIVDGLAPILDVMARPASAIAEVVEHVRELASLRTENARLKTDNQHLQHWETVARRLQNENAVLHEQLNFVPDLDSALGQTMLLNAGSRDGVRKGQAVLSGESLVGYIVDVGDRSSRLLLLTDINAHLPVMLESTRTRAILSGDNKDRPKLGYIAGNPNIQVGDRVVTSSSGAAFPPGLPVGIVASVADGTTRIEPYVRRTELDYVAVVDYGLGGILPFSDKPPPPPPTRHRGGAEN